MSKFEVIRAEDGFDLPPLNQEDGTSFGYADRWQVGMTPDGKYLTDYADWEARDIFDMISKDYKAKQIENVLSLPIMSAEYQITAGKGDTGEATWLQDYWDADFYQGGCRTSLDQIIGLCTSAFYYKRSYFEKVWTKGTGAFEGKFVYGDVAFRPQTTCRLMREPITGRYAGFEQEGYYVGPEIAKSAKWPIQIEPNRAFVFTHGTRKDPLNGVSDMEVAFWAYKTKQKILMLWFQFVQAVSLPRIVVKATDDGTAKQVGREVARLKSSGVLPIAVPAGPSSVSIDVLDISGKGHEQFKEIIQWLDNAAVQSILAGFLDLTAGNASQNPSYALSADASDFFLQSLEAKTRELEDQIRTNLFAPLIFANFGKDAVVPRLQFEPLNDIDKAAALQLLTAAMAMPPGGPVPSSFVAGLAEQVSNYLGLDGNEMKEAFKSSFDAAAAQAKAEALATQAPGAGSDTGQAIAGLAGAVGAASQAVAAGVDPRTASKAAQEAHGADSKVAADNAKAAGDTRKLVAKHIAGALKAKTGGDVTLSHPSNPEADRETEQIRARRGAYTSPHKFKSAKWTHPNSHPRCSLCGDEEPIGGICAGYGK